MDWREQISKRLDETDRTRADLSVSMGITAPSLTRLLHTGSNPTVETLERVGEACGLELRIEFVEPERASVRGGACEHGAIPWCETCQGRD